MERKGKFIVIEGSDGSGKATQVKKLAAYLKKQGQKVHVVDFPQYYDSFYGKIVARYLNGEFGKLFDVNPYLVSLAYALDRATKKTDMNNWLNNGDYIIANRYTFSNMAFQSAKLSPNKRAEFIAWDNELEYKINNLPRENIVIFLYIPVKISRTLVDQRDSRQYTAKKRDIHERNMSYLQKVEKQYLDLAKLNKHVYRIDCFKNLKLRSIPDIHEEVIKLLQQEKII